MVAVDVKNPRDVDMDAIVDAAWDLLKQYRYEQRVLQSAWEDYAALRNRLVWNLDSEWEAAFNRPLDDPLRVDPTQWAIIREFLRS